jgi:hypothetical protein
MTMLPPTPIQLVPGLLRARGLAIGMKKLREALNGGAIPGTYDQSHWTMTAEDVAAAERYFRKVAAPGWKGGAGGLEQARARSR